MGKKQSNWVVPVLVIIAIAGLGLYFFGGDLQTQAIVGDSRVPATCDKKLVVESHTFLTQDALSGSRTAVSGDIEIYEAGDDPTDPLASPVASATLSSGEAVINGSHYTCTPYRVVHDGGSGASYYSEDFGVIVFDDDAYNANTGKMTTDLGDFTAIATISDMLTETVNSTDLNGGDWIGNESAAAVGEIKSETADTIYYDESSGDGSFYIIATLEASGSNSALESPVLCFDHDDTNAPEGNEITAFTAQRQTGSDLGIPSSLLDYWANELCVELPNPMEAGTSGEYKFTITVSESNLDTNDDWSMNFDDLGEINGKDIGLRSGASKDLINFDSVA